MSYETPPESRFGEYVERRKASYWLINIKNLKEFRKEHPETKYWFVLPDKDYELNRLVRIVDYDVFREGIKMDEVLERAGLEKAVLD
jgi:hypothetical protein